MAQKKSNDELMEFLDSFDIDEDYTVLSNKMDEFTREKKKRQLDKQEDVIVEQPQEMKVAPESISNTIIAPLKQETPSDAGGKTRVFSGGTPNGNKAGGETVVINNQQSYRYFQEDEDPDEILRREVIDEFNGQPMLGEGLKKLLFIVVGAVVVFILFIGGYKVVNSFMKSEKTEEVDTEKEAYFNEIKAWAQSFQTLDEEQKTQIQSLESKFNKLSDKQKEEINEILKSKVGKTFDELLAEAKTEKTEDKKNNNTELAEKKAELKAQIQEAQAAMESAEAAKQEAEDALKQAETDYNDAQTLKDNGSAEVDAALAALNEIEKDALLPSDEFNEKYKSNEAWTAARNEAKDYYYQKASEMSSLEINLNNAYYAYNVATEAYNSAKSTYDSCVNTYNDLVNQYNALDSE